MTTRDSQHDPVMNPDERELAQLARASLDDSVAHLDAETLSRLNRARQRALAEDGRPFLRRHWLSASAAACAALAIAVVIPLTHTGNFSGNGAQDGYHHAAGDAAVVEDLDLVLWLTEDNDHAG